jgi:beta-lactamase regulating signal transducer with metallopeptidase domain
MKYLHTKKYSLMSGILKYSFIFLIAVSMLLSFSTVQACTNGGVEPDCVAPAVMDRTAGRPAVMDRTIKTPPTTLNISTGIENPLGNSVTDLPSFIEKILGFVLVVGVPIVTLAIIYAGFLFVIARGNPEELTKAKKTLLYTLIGAALLLGSFIIAKAIQGTVVELSK